MEVWKPITIDNQNTDYHVSSLGRIRSTMCGKLKPRKIHINPSHGYIQVVLRINSRPRTFRVHRLVLQAFIINPQMKPQVNHKNGIKTDNRVENLEWSTAKENMRHSFNVLDRKPPQKGKFNSHRSKPVIQIDPRNHKEINHYPSIREAMRQTGIGDNNIHAVLSGKSKISGGYYWKYA